MEKEAVAVCLRGPGAMLESHGQGHLTPPTGPRRRVVAWHLACKKPKQVAKLALSEGSKQPQGDLWKQLLGCPALGLPCRKKPVWAPGPGYRWMPRVFCTQELSTVQIGLGSRALSCRANMTEEPCGGWLDVPWECGSPPWVQGPRGQCHSKMTS